MSRSAGATVERADTIPVVNENDPLWTLRHALVGLAVSLLLSVPIAALLGRWIGGLIGDDYGSRVAVYGVLLLYVLVGAVVLFVRVGQHEKKPLGPARMLLWLISLWAWPALFALARREPPR